MEPILRLAGQVEAWVDHKLSWIEQSRSPWTVRGVGLVLALPSWTVLSIAHWLQPDPAGFGTHRQLGLAGCTVMTLTGWPCPMCGMTTTFSHLAHGEILAGALNQPFGVVLFSMTALAAVVGAIDLIGGQGAYKRVLRWIKPYEQRIAAGLLFGLVGGWIWKMVEMHPSTFGLGG